MKFCLAFVLALPATAGAFAPPRAVIFDCDGVLVESEALKGRAWTEALASVGVHFEDAEYRPLVGMDNRAMLRKIAQLKGVTLAPTLIEKKEEAYHRLQEKGVPRRPEGIALVKYLALRKARLGIKLALASGGMKSEILENLKQIGLDHAFDEIVSGTDDLKAYKDPEGTNKPKPYVYLEAARRLKIKPELAVVFEDSAAGVDAAASAGMTAIAIPNDYTKDQDFKNATARLNLGKEPKEVLEPLLAGKIPF